MWSAGGFNIVEWLGKTVRGPATFPFTIDFPGETQPTLEQILQAAQDAYNRFRDSIEQNYPGRLGNYGRVIDVQISFLTFSF